MYMYKHVCVVMYLNILEHVETSTIDTLIINYVKLDGGVVLVVLLLCLPVRWPGCVVNLPESWYCYLMWIVC